MRGRLQPPRASFLTLLRYNQDPRPAVPGAYLENTSPCPFTNTFAIPATSASKKSSSTSSRKSPAPSAPARKLRFNFPSSPRPAPPPCPATHQVVAAVAAVAAAAISAFCSVRKRPQARRQGCYIIRELGGHGIGSTIHEDPSVHNCPEVFMRALQRRPHPYDRAHHRRGYQ